MQEGPQPRCWQRPHFPQALVLENLRQGCPSSSFPYQPEAETKLAGGCAQT